MTHDIKLLAAMCFALTNLAVGWAPFSPPPLLACLQGVKQGEVRRGSRDAESAVYGRAKYGEVEVRECKDTRGKRGAEMFLMSSIEVS